MSLSARLKSIYASGDAFTVLKLIEELIKAIEEYELKGIGKNLYRHHLTIQVGDTNRKCTIVNTSGEKLTTTEKLDDLYGAKTDEIYYVLEDEVELII